MKVKKLNNHDISNHESHPWFDGDKVYPQLLHIHIRDDHDFISVSDENLGCVFRYEYEDGYYRMLNDDACKLLIKSHIPAEIRKPAQWEQVFKELYTNPVDINVDDLNADESVINFKNGLLDINTSKLQPHSPEILSTVQIPCNYRPELTLSDAPFFSKFLEDMTSGKEELKTLILEYMGAIISNIKGYRYKKFIIFNGAGNTGKSQLRDLTMKLIGKQNCHSIGLRELNARFGTSQIYGMRLIGNGDLASVNLDEINTLKELTGGDDLNAEFKGKDGFSFKFLGFLWYNSNQLPSFKGDQGSHVYERFIIIPCANVIPLDKRNSSILEKMLKEKEAIVSVVVKYLQRTVEQGYRFTEGPIILDTRKEYRCSNNSLYEFIDTQCEVGKSRTKRSVVISEYKSWCLDHHIDNVLGKKNIALSLERDYGMVVKRVQGEYYYPIMIKKF